MNGKIQPINFGIKISLYNPEGFLLVKETLTRIGVASNRSKTLYQSAHILHKQNEYFICHFKDMFVLDGKSSDISDEDIARRNLIAKLLQDWKLITIINPEQLAVCAPISAVKILSHKEKEQWQLVSKYTIGNKVKCTII